VFFVALFLSSFSSALNINNCTTLDQSDTWYDLTADVLNSSWNFCMNVTANNVTLDCNYHLIQGLDFVDTYGVLVNSTSNFTLFNCNVTNWYYGVFVNASNGTNVSYSNFSSDSVLSSVSVLLFNANKVVIQDNLFYHHCDVGVNISSNVDDLFIKRNSFNSVCLPNDGLIYEIFFDYQPLVENKLRNIFIEFNDFQLEEGHSIGGMIEVNANYSNVTIQHNNFAFNHSGGAVYYAINFWGDYDYPAIVYNNKFYGNTDDPVVSFSSSVGAFSGANASNNFFNQTNYALTAGILNDSVFYNNTMIGGGAWLTANNKNVSFDCAGAVANGSTATGFATSGIHVFGENNTVKNCLVYDSEAGIEVQANSTVFNNTIKNIFNAFGPAFGISLSGDNSNASYNFIHNATIGVYLTFLSNALLQNNVINYSQRFALNLYSNAYNITSTNDVISSALNAFDFAFGDFDFMGLTSGSSAMLLNTSFNKSAVVFNESDSYSNLTVAWFTDVRVIDSGSNPVANAELNITNVNGTSLLNASTNATGWIDRQVITEYWQDNQTVLNFTPHYFNASKTGFNSSTVVFPITADPLVTIMLAPLGGPEAPYAVAILTPANDSWANQQYLNITGICNSSTTPLVNASLQYNGSTQTNTSNVLNATAFYFNVSVVNDGFYYYNITCYSTNTLSNTSETRLLKIDSTPPVVTINAPVNGSTWTLPPVINGTVVEANLDAIWTNSTNYFGLDSSTPFNFSNTSALPDGNYSIKVLANDSVNNSGEAYVFFTISSADATPPTVTLVSPEDGHASNETLSIFSFTAIDETSISMNCSLYLNGTRNQTNASVSNNTLTSFEVHMLPEGTTTWRVDCSDGVGNTGNSASRVIKIDRTPPFFFNIAVDALTNIASLTWTASELAASWVEYGISTGLGLNSSINPFAVNHATTLSSLSACTLHFFKIWGFDEVGNLGKSEVNNFTTQGCEGGGGGGGGSSLPTPSPLVMPTPSVSPTVLPTIILPFPTITPSVLPSAWPLQVASGKSLTSFCFNVGVEELEVKRVLTVFKVDSVFYTLVNLTVSNKGTSVIREVRVTEEIPQALATRARFLNSPASLGDGKVTWIAGTLAPGESKSFAYLLPGRFETKDFTLPTVSGKTVLVSLDLTALFELLLLLALLIVAVSSYLRARRKQTH